MAGKVICIYHKNCTDGTVSAAVLLKKFPDCETFPLDHGYTEEEFEELLRNVDSETTIYISDFSLRKDDLLKLIKKAKKIINIDHHIGVKDLLEEISNQYDNYEFYFDNNHSGASLTWKYLFGEPIPYLVKLVEDKDIWRWEYGDDTKYLNAYLIPLTNKPEEIKELLDSDIKQLIEKGKIISKFQDYLIERFVEKTEELLLNIGNYKIKGYNTGLFQSEIGNILSTKLGEAVVLFSINGYNVKLSFRSCEGQSPTALDLAKILGGGGHKNAAGALVSLKEFFNLIIFEDGGEK
ncbi:DHH family phosphoesterase [Persephonella sp.]